MYQENKSLQDESGSSCRESQCARAIYDSILCPYVCQLTDREKRENSWYQSIETANNNNNNNNNDNNKMTSWQEILYSICIDLLSGSKQMGWWPEPVKTDINPKFTDWVQGSRQGNIHQT